MGDIANPTAINPRNYILMGPQGSGKGTQSRLIVKRLRLQYVATGDVLRKMAETPSPLGEKIKNIIEEGNLLPDELLMQIFHNEIQTLNRNTGILIDGTPRTIFQAEKLDEMFGQLGLSLPEVIAIEISKREALRRISTRKICPKCQTPFMPIDKSSVSGICQKCGGEIITREDDSDSEAVDVRLEEYYSETAPLLDRYQKLDRVIKINGEQSVEKVTQDIFEKIQ